MSAVVTIERQGRVAIVGVDNPPVNAIGQAVRQGLFDAFTSFACDTSIDRIILRGSGGRFPAGADIHELDGPPRPPALCDVAAAIENCPVPVIAALEGAVLGGGLELALACDLRITSSGTVFGMPEVNLGIIPGAGGTQRLPRLVGIDAALDMITSGKSIDADQAVECGLVDCVDDTPVEAALTGATPSKRRLSGARFPAESADFVAGYVPKKKAGAAVSAAIEAVRAGLDSFPRGIDRERELFLRLRDSEEAVALRYLFFAERVAGKPKDLVGVAAPVERVGVVGAGTMGAGIAAAMIKAGLHVLVVERSEGALETGLQKIRDILDRHGSASEARLDGTTRIAEVGNMDLVIEAAFEDMEVKRTLFRKLDDVTGKNTVLATNTSFLDVDAIAEETSRPDQVLGLHFFSPAHVMRLLEVVRSRHTSDDTLLTGLVLAKRLAKIPVVAGVCDGFIVNRIGQVYRRECEFMLEEGCLPQDIDAAMRDFGFAMGPFEVADLAGLDISWSRRRRLAATRPSDERYVHIADRLCEAGRFGQKSGKGWYHYEEGSRRPLPDPLVEKIIGEERAKKGIAQSRFERTRIQFRALGAIINEGANTLADGIAARASDIDVAIVNGLGFPRHRGGPFFWASRQNPELITRAGDDVAAAAGIRHRRAEGLEQIFEGLMPQ